MKNIHLLPTDKPSRLFKDFFYKYFISINIDQEQNHFKPQHIYITSDEPIKEGDWVITNNGLLAKVTTEFTWHFINSKKIILTTDQDLIKDSVQAIDDKFLEWFVKNPSCESVEVDKNWNYPLDKSWEYKLRIIPQEEQRQHLIDIMRGDEELGLYEEPKQIKCYCGHTTYCDCSPLEEPKQETLEGAAEKYTPLRIERKAFIEGAKWQTERMYSEEESIQKIIDYVDFQFNTGGELNSEIKKWFEQFKKK
jgi:hypothetical protein